MRWVRPLHQTIGLFEGQVIGLDLPGALDKSGTKTLGHRFLAPEPFEVSSFADYQKKLRKAHVVLTAWGVSQLVLSLRHSVLRLRLRWIDLAVEELPRVEIQVWG